MNKRFVLLTLCVAWSGIASSAVYWNNSQGDNSFTNDLNWGGGVGPSAYPAVNMTGSNQAKLLTGETEARPTILWIGNNAGTTGEMTVDGGSLTVNQLFYVGYYGTGTFHMNSGSVQTTLYDIHAGYNAGSSGTINMSGGQMTTKRHFSVGAYGAGVMTMSGGTNTVIDYDVTLARYAGSSGTLTMTDGTMDVPRDFIAGYAGDGVMTMSGGTINAAGSFYVARVAGSTGQLDFSGGTITAAGFFIGSGTTSAGMVDFRGTAKMILDGNDVSTIQGYIDDGYLTGGKVAYDTANNQTVIDPITPPVNVGLYLLR